MVCATNALSSYSTATESVVVHNGIWMFLVEIDHGTRNCVRLVNFLGRPYLLSQDISALIPIPNGRKGLSYKNGEVARDGHQARGGQRPAVLRGVSRGWCPVRIMVAGDELPLVRVGGAHGGAEGGGEEIRPGSPDVEEGSGANSGEEKWTSE